MFTAQENLEGAAAGLSLRGLDVVLGHGMAPFLVILATTLFMSFAVALVRWRRRVLLGRLARRGSHVVPRHGASPPGVDPPGAVASVQPTRWGRRAPPKVASTIAL